jgi:hypothetical protein
MASGAPSPIEHPGRNLQEAVCLRTVKSAAEKHAIGLLDDRVNPHLVRKPGMMCVQNLTPDGLVGVLKPCCTTRCDLIRGSVGWPQPSMPQTSYRNAAKALRSPMAPRLGLMFQLCKMATTRLSGRLDKSRGQRQRRTDSTTNSGNLRGRPAPCLVRIAAI